MVTPTELPLVLNINEVDNESISNLPMHFRDNSAIWLTDDLYLVNLPIRLNLCPPYLRLRSSTRDIRASIAIDTERFPDIQMLLVIATLPVVIELAAEILRAIQNDSGRDDARS